MINVTYGGKSFEVPPYVKYAAADKDKKVYGYSIKPKFDGSEGYWGIEYGAGCSVYLGELDAVENAPTYLTRVEAIRAPKKKPKGKVTVSNNDAVIEFLLSQLRQQLTNNPYKQQCEDLAHEVLSLKNQLRDASALVAELQETIKLMNEDFKRTTANPEYREELSQHYKDMRGGTLPKDEYYVVGEHGPEQSGCRKDDTQECEHEWLIMPGLFLSEGNPDNVPGSEFCVKCGKREWDDIGYKPKAEKEDTQECEHEFVFHETINADACAKCGLKK